MQKNTPAISIDSKNCSAKKNPMKVLFIANKVPFPPKDGGSLATHDLVKGLESKGAEVTFFGLNTNKHRVDMKRVAEENPGIRFITYPVNLKVTPWGALWSLLKGDSYNIARFRFSQVDKGLQALLQKETFDVVHIETLFMMPYLDTIKKYSQAKVVLRTQNVEHIIWELMALESKNILKRWYLKTLANRLMEYEIRQFNKPDLMLAISSEDAAVFRNLGCIIPIEVHPTGFDFTKLKEFSHITPSRDFFHLGAMDWKPNVEGMDWFLNRVWTDFSHKYPQQKMHLAGRKMPPVFSSMSDNALIVHGEVENAYRFMAEHEVMVVPLFSGSGLRIKIIEAMAMGKCIIATPLAASGIDVQDGVHILIADGAIQFAQCMELCMNHPERVKQIGREAQQFAIEHFDHMRLADKVHDLYTSLL
jgi:glycosyltransferase involved in cell wall biosynthesis